MEFVFDTNVLVSAGLFPQSLPFRVLDRVLTDYRLLFSPQTLAELEEVLQRPKFARKLSATYLREFIDRLVGDARVMIPSVSITACRDPKDDKFLSLAVAGTADAIVTGDADLLALHPFRGVAILTPQQFVDRYDTT